MGPGVRAMIPVPATDEQIAKWAERDGVPSTPHVIGGPHEGGDVIPCPALVAHTADGAVVHVAFKLDEIEVARLAQGGTLWLTTWGGLPVHLVEVV